MRQKEKNSPNLGTTFSPALYTEDTHVVDDGTAAGHEVDVVFAALGDHNAKVVVGGEVAEGQNALVSGRQRQALADAVVAVEKLDRHDVVAAVRHLHNVKVILIIHTFKNNTGSSKINGADACSVRANWLCIGWPFCLAELKREFQTGGNFFLHPAVYMLNLT